MKITIQQQNDAMHFEGRNAQGNTVQFDGSPEFGGEGLGIRPMEGVLMSLASCSAFDVVSLMKKMRQPLQRLSVEVDSQRRDEIPKIFTHIHLKFVFEGDVERDKAEKAVALSADKYCSVSKMLEPLVEITHSVEILPAS
jgi:putative redox protein